MRFAEALNITRGTTAIIGSGGKTSLMLRLAQELSSVGKVIVTTSTHIFPPQKISVVSRVGSFECCICVGTPCAEGKLRAPAQSFEELAALTDFLLIEADGSKHLPLKAHLAHEPVIPNASHVICVLGASGLNQPIAQAVHRSERFLELTGQAVATPQAVADALKQENLAHRYLINQAETNLAAAQELARLLPKPTVLASIQKGEILCSF